MRVFLLTFALAVAVSQTEAQVLTFLAFGDSVTVGHGDGEIRCPDNTEVGGYPPRLTERLALQGSIAAFVNHGVCGETTASGISRIDTVLDGGGDVIVIMEGTNDVSMGVSLESTLFNLSEMGKKAALAGVVRGLIAPGRAVTAGLKIGDVDPRGDPDASSEISDKALAVGGGVLEAVLTHLNRQER